MPQILYFIGLPASGKSTYAAKYKDLDSIEIVKYEPQVNKDLEK